MKNVLKQVFSVFLAILLVGSAIAVSANLNTYPNNLDEKVTIVVGEDALGSDFLAGQKIQNSLSDNTNSDTEELSGVLADVEIGQKLSETQNIDTRLTDSDIEGLIDSYINFDSERIDVSELLIVGGNAKDVTVASSLTGDEDYGSNIVLEVDKGAIRYFYNFDDSIDLSQVTDDEPLDIVVLGSPITITKINSDSSFTAIVGETKTLNPGEKITVNSHEITLTNVNENGKINLDVDGVSKTLNEGSSLSVKGIEIYNKETFYDQDYERRDAVIVVGEEAVQTYRDGDAFIGEDEDNPDWIWNIGNLEVVEASSPTETTDGTGPFIGVVNDFILDDAKDNPPGIGEYINLPNNYLKIGIESLTTDEEELQTYTIEFETSEDLSEALSDDSKSSEDVVRITSTDDEGLVVRAADLKDSAVSTVKTNEIILFPKSATELAIIYNDDDENELKLAGLVDTLNTDLTIGNVDHGKNKADDLIFTVNYNPTSDELTVKVVPNDVTSDEITALFGLTNNVVTSLGVEKSKEETTELTHNAISVGTKDVDLRSKFGIIIEDPESNGADDRVSLRVPTDQVEATIDISRGSKTTVSEPKDIELVTFEGELTEADLNGDLILIGGPAVNPLSAKYLDAEFQSYGTTEEFPYELGEGMIKVVERDGKTIIIVAGFDADDTTALAEKLASGEGLEGDLVEL